MKEDRYYSRSYSRQQKTINVVIQIVLLVLGIMWILPLMWIILTSFRAEPGSYTSYFWPKGFTLDNYMRLLFEDQQFKFSQWFLNTFIVAVVSCIGSTFIVLAVSYALSRLRFKMRKPMMNVALILGMFPGFMSMVAIYYILKGLGLTENPLVCLTLVYISGSGLTYYIAKGFFDTIPVSLREAARLEGASEATIFTKIIIPLSKPMIVYTIINAFLNPWMDFVMARIMIKSKDSADWTVAIGLYNLLQKTLIGDYFSIFCAGGVMIAIPISILFVVMQKFYVEGVTGGAVKG